MQQKIFRPVFELRARSEPTKNVDGALLTIREKKRETTDQHFLLSSIEPTKAVTGVTDALKNMVLPTENVSDTTDISASSKVAGPLVNEQV